MIGREWRLVHTVEDEVGHKSARALFNVDTYMLSARCVAHLKDDVLQTSCLSSRPVNPGDGLIQWYIGHVEVEIPNLSPEDVGGTKVKVGPVLPVRVTVNEANCTWYVCEVCSGKDGGHTIRIADELGVIVVDD